MSKVPQRLFARMTEERAFSAEICASQGVRVIAFARRRVEEFDGFELENMILAL